MLLWRAECCRATRTSYFQRHRIYCETFLFYLSRCCDVIWRNVLLVHQALSVKWSRDIPCLLEVQDRRVCGVINQNRLIESCYLTRPNWTFKVNQLECLNCNGYGHLCLTRNCMFSESIDNDGLEQDCSNSIANALELLGVIRLILH